MALAAGAPGAAAHAGATCAPRLDRDCAPGAAHRVGDRHGHRARRLAPVPVAVGNGVADSIRRVVHELAPPRSAGLRRAVAIATAAALIFTAGLAILSSGLAPQGGGGAWIGAP